MATAYWPGLGLGLSAVLGNDPVQKEERTPDIQPALSCCPGTAADAPVGVGPSYGEEENETLQDFMML